MKGLHKVNDSKAPTIDQLKRMVQNLQKTYPKSYVCINPNIVMYSSGSIKVEYWLSVEGRLSNYIQSWSETMAEYRRLMKESSND